MRRSAKAIDALKGAGAEVVDVKVPTYNDWNDAEFSVLLYEFKDGLNALSEEPAARRTRHSKP